MSGPQLKVKSFDIRKRLVCGAWEKVQANAGAPGVDAVSITMLDDRLGPHRCGHLRPVGLG